MMKYLTQKISRFSHIVGHVFVVLWQSAIRFWWDDGFSRAAALAYTTLFALVPITALSLLMYSSFGVDREQVGKTVEHVLNQVLPPTTAVEFVPSAKKTPNVAPDESKTVAKIANYNVQTVRNEQLSRLRDEITQYLLLLADHARTLGILTIAVLFFIGISLLNTIESALNTVWRTSSSLSIAAKILSFWAVITLGPLLIALSIYISTKANSFGLIKFSDSIEYSFAYSFILPMLISTMAVTLLFYKLPAATVRIRDAMFGGIVAALLFEFVKIGFSYYLTKSSGYSALYGVIATIPLFLFWLYLSWVVVIYGAEASYLAGSMYVLSGLKRYVSQLGEMGVIMGLRALCYIAQRFLNGEPAPTESEIAMQTGADPVLLRSCLNTLSESEILSKGDERTNARTLLKTPEKLRISDVVRAFRTKKYRHLLKGIDDPIGESAQIGADVYLLDLIRLRSIKKQDQRPVSDWTIQDLLAGEQNN
ncbi:MAG: YihY family inner membrane protein [Deltaproteobacteria bacterium]|nr:YihY family inner membrane protein [Deltaproteobacteria bacterium]